MSEKQADEKDTEASPTVERLVERVMNMTREEQIKVGRRLDEMVKRLERTKPSGRKV